MLLNPASTLQSETLTFPKPDVAARYELAPDPEYHGSDGPLQNTYPRYLPELRDRYVETLRVLGIPNNPDPVRMTFSNIVFQSVKVAICRHAAPISDLTSPRPLSTRNKLYEAIQQLFCSVLTHFQLALMILS